MVWSAEVDRLYVDEAEVTEVVVLDDQVEVLDDQVVVEVVVDDETFVEGDIAVLDPVTSVVDWLASVYGVDSSPILDQMEL